MKYDTFLFDFDGTIVNSIEAIVLSMTDTFKHFDLTPPPAETIKHYIGVPVEVIPYLDIEKGERRTAFVAEFRSRMSEDKARELVYAYDGIRDLLLELKAAGAKLGIVSSKGTSGIVMTLEDTDMEGIFDGIIGSDQVTHYKPHPETVFLCAQQIGLADAAKTLVIGDAHHDIEMGQNAGMDTCAVPWGAGTEEVLRACKPTYFVKDMDEFVEVLKGKG